MGPCTVVMTFLYPCAVESSILARRRRSEGDGHYRELRFWAIDVPEPVEPAPGQLVEHGVGLVSKIEVEAVAELRVGSSDAGHGVRALLPAEIKHASPCAVTGVPSAQISSTPVNVQGNPLSTLGNAVDLFFIGWSGFFSHFGLTEMDRARLLLPNMKKCYFQKTALSLGGITGNGVLLVVFSDPCHFTTQPIFTLIY